MTSDASQQITGSRGDPPDGWMTPRRFAAILALTILAVFPGVALGWRTFYRSDYGVIFYQAIHYCHQCFWRGELPLWNPLSNCGVPFLAQWGCMALYPLSLIYLVFPLPWSLGFFCLGHLWLGGVGMFKLTDRWVANRFAAAVAGFAFVFSGVALSCLIWPNYTAALAWAPWLVLCGQKAWQQGGRHLLLGAGIGALQMLTGAPELTVLTWLLLLALWLRDWVFESARRRAFAWRFAMMAPLVAGLAAAQLLPFLELLVHSQRDQGFATGKWSMPLWGWANLLVPLFHYFESYQGDYVQNGQGFIASYYLGIGVLALAILAGQRIRQWPVPLLFLALLSSLVLAWGEKGLVYAWLRNLLPFFGVARFPVKFMLLVVLVAPWLAAYTVASVTRPTASDFARQNRWLIVVGSVFLCLIAIIIGLAYWFPLPYDQWPLAWHSGLSRALFLVVILGALAFGRQLTKVLPIRAIQLGIVALVVLDGITALPRHNPTLEAKLLTPGLSELQPRPKPGESRIMISPQAEASLLRSKVPEPVNDILGKRLALWSHLNLLEEIPKVNGSATLQIREQARIQKCLYAAYETNASGCAPLMDFLGVSHITAPNKVVEWTNRTNYLPMITAGQKPIFGEPDYILTALMRPGFDPRQVVYLPAETSSLIPVPEACSAVIRSVHFAAQGLEFTVDAPRDCLASIAQSFYHAWHAYVDGKPARLWPANYAFQAVVVPAGRHQVRLVYEDAAFRAGTLISAVTMAGAVAAWLGLRRRVR